MPYAIMRSKKLNNFGSIASSLQHAYRERQTVNANSDAEIDNINLVNSSCDEAMGMLRDRLDSLDKSPRSNSVKCVEYVFTASPEWWDSASRNEQEEFIECSSKWLEDKYGESNIIASVVHHDETTPHISAFVVPITPDGRLSARDFLGGRVKMKEQQDSFYDNVKHLGLNRGIEKSNSKHKDIKTYYGSVNASKSFLSDIKERINKAVPEPTLADRAKPKEYAQKVKVSVVNSVSNELRKSVQMNDLIDEYERMKKRIEPFFDELKKVKAENERVQSELSQYKEAFHSLVKSIGGKEEAQRILLEVKQQKEAERKQEQERRRAERSNGLGFSR